MSDDQQLVIEQAWDNRAELDTGDGELRDAVDAAIASLDDGSARVAQPDGDGASSLHIVCSKNLMKNK